MKTAYRSHSSPFIEGSNPAGSYCFFSFYILFLCCSLLISFLFIIVETLEILHRKLTILILQFEGKLECLRTVNQSPGVVQILDIRLQRLTVSIIVIAMTAAELCTHIVSILPIIRKVMVVWKL